MKTQVAEGLVEELVRRKLAVLDLTTDAGFPVTGRGGLPIDPPFDMARANMDFELGRGHWEEVSLDRVIAQQTLVRTDTLVHMLRSPEEVTARLATCVPMDCPAAVHWGDHYYLTNGHHYASTQRLLGKAKAPFYVVEGRRKLRS